MYSAKATTALTEGVMARSLRKVNAAILDGADVNGPPNRHCTPLMLATVGNDVSIASLLLDNSADPDIPASVAIIPPNDLHLGVVFGERALHLAVKIGSVEIASLLLKKARADPNVADKNGCTPLITACEFCGCKCVELVRLLLEAGADPALREEHGYTTLHLAARQGLTDVVDMLHTAAPAMLNSYTTEDRRTPLALACMNDNQSTVSRLLSLGAIELMPLDQNNRCPLAEAAMSGCVGVVRILIKQGLGVVGGFKALPRALYSALLGHQAKIVRLLLVVAREEAPMIDWVNFVINKTMSLIHCGAASCCPASVSVLLAAGADETVLDSEGRLPQDVIGIDCDLEELPMDGWREFAIRRMLNQGPAYRARSWAWPADGLGAICCACCACCCDNGVDAILSCPPAAPKDPVNVQPPRPKSDGTFFVGLVCR